MDGSTYVSYLYAFMLDTVVLAGVPLAVATACSLVVAIFQALTQIQDQTLAQTVKIVAITIMLLVFGGTLVSSLVTHSATLLDEFARIGR